MANVDVIQVLKDCDALLEGHFLLSSGKHSNRYVQCAKVLRFPDQAEKVLSVVVDKIKDLDIDLVVGPAMGGVVVSYELGRQLGKEAIFTERKNNIMEVLEELGGQVIGVACIANRTKDDIGMPIYSAIDLDIQVYDEGSCPLCDAGQIDLVKPGSREFKNEK